MAYAKNLLRLLESRRLGNVFEELVRSCLEKFDLLRTSKLLEGRLGLHRLRLRGKRPTGDKLHRPARSRVLGALFGVVVLVYAALEICGHARVEALVGAFEDVQVPVIGV